MELIHLKKEEEINKGILSLTKIFIGEYPYYSKWIESKKSEFEKFEKEVISINDSNQIVGYVMIHNGESSFKINGIYIFPEYEGKGYASETIKKLLEEATVVKKKYALIQTRFHNNAVVHMFDKIGFTIVGENFHNIEKRDNWVAVYDIRKENNILEMIEIAKKEYPGFISMTKDEINMTRKNYLDADKQKQIKNTTF